MEAVMEICPDCLTAGISQEIRLQYVGGKMRCPDCGGAFDERWIPAPKYGPAERIMIGDHPRLTKRHGKWRRQ